MVSEKIARQLAVFHAQWHETVSLAQGPDHQRIFYKRGIKVGHGGRRVDLEVGVHVFELESKPRRSFLRTIGKRGQGAGRIAINASLGYHEIGQGAFPSLTLNHKKVVSVHDGYPMV